MRIYKIQQNKPLSKTAVAPAAAESVRSEFNRVRGDVASFLGSQEAVNEAQKADPKLLQILLSFNGVYPDMVRQWLENQYNITGMFGLSSEEVMRNIRHVEMLLDLLRAKIGSARE